MYGCTPVHPLNSKNVDSRADTPEYNAFQIRLTRRKVEIKYTNHLRHHRQRIAPCHSIPRNFRCVNTHNILYLRNIGMLRYPRRRNSCAIPEPYNPYQQELDNLSKVLDNT